MYVCAAYKWLGPEEAKRGYRSSRTEVTGGCELWDVGAGSQTWVLCKEQQVLLTTEPVVLAPPTVSVLVLFCSVI